MADALPARANLDWLRKAAKQHLRTMRLQRREAKLAEAQYAVARQYGFASWRKLKSHVDSLRNTSGAAQSLTPDATVAAFLRAVGDGRLHDVEKALAADPRLVNAVGPHPYWGGRPQALHVSIETKRREMFDLLLAAGADIDSANDEYEHWSPLMLTFHWDQPDLRKVLLERGARIGLVEAMLFEDDAAVENMLRRGRSALPKSEPNGGSLLAFARTPFVIDRLLELGVSSDKKDRWDTTPMEAMSRLGPRGLPLVRHLLHRGIKASPQEYARLGDRVTLADLLAHDPAIATSDAVMMGAVDFGHQELARWLLSRGANVNASTEGRGHTALHSAAWNGDLEMVKLLVVAGADISVRDAEHDNTPAGCGSVEGAPERLAVDGDHPLEAFGKALHEGDKAGAELGRLEQTEHAAECVVARDAFLQAQERLEESLLGAAEQRHVGAGLATAQDRPQRDQQNLVQIVLLGVARARVFQLGKGRGKGIHRALSIAKGASPQNLFATPLASRNLQMRFPCPPHAYALSSGAMVS